MDKSIKYTVILSGIFLLLVLPKQYLFQDFSACIYKSITGLDCPLCGMTRATYYFIRFQLNDAVLYNPMVLFLPLLLILEVITDLYPLWKPAATIRKISWITFGVALIILFAIRAL